MVWLTVICYLFNIWIISKVIKADSKVFNNFLYKSEQYNPKSTHWNFNDTLRISAVEIAGVRKGVREYFICEFKSASPKTY